MIVSTFLLSMAFAKPSITEESNDLALGLLSKADTQSPYGRLRVALMAADEAANEDVLASIARTHPNIVLPFIRTDEQRLLNYIQNLPGTERNKLNRSEHVIRTPDQMSKSEKKTAKSIAKRYGIKKLRAIWIC